MKHKLLSLFVALTCATALFAYDCEIDGIYYNLYSHYSSYTASVTAGNSKYSGSIVIPSNITYRSKTYSVTSIESSAFQGCSGLTSVTIGNSVTTIGWEAFYNCKGLISVTIPNSVTTIGYGAFYNCSSLTSVIIPNSVTEIGHSAFEGCSGLTSVTIGNSVTTIESSTFSGCYSLISVTIPNSVTEIGFSAFRECKNLTSVTIPNSVTTIEGSAFESCTGLTSVNIPNSVTTIGTYAFYFVNNIVYNGTATGSPWEAKCVNGYVDGYLVYNDATKTTLCGCSSAAMGEIIIPNSVTTIGEGAFAYCSGLTSVTIPNSVIMIEQSAFLYVNNIVYNGTIGWIYGLGAKCVNGYVDGYLVYSDATKTTLCGCSSAAIGEIVIPNSVTTIGDYAFYNCSSLTSVIIPNSVTTIGKGAFRYCYGLTSVTIPNSVKTIGYEAFGYCFGLTSVTIPNSVTAIGDYAFQWCFGLTSVTIGNSVTTISDYAFYSCYGLTSVTIPNSVTTIGYSAFYGCPLSSVRLPYSISSIGDEAFSGVQTITIPNWIKSLGYEWLGGSYRSEEKTVYVVISPFEYNNNPENLNVINPIIKSASYHATLIPQPAEVATWTTTPTTIEMDIDLTNIPTTHLYDSISIDYFGEENDIENILAPSTQNHVIFTGLTPNQKANIYYTSKKIGDDDWEEGAKLEIRLPKLDLTTLVPKVVSAGTAIVAAETNISDYETNVGFEWRKYDAPESMPSKSGAAILFNGMMEGKLLNLGTDSYWNVRPYYEAADGTRYYGEWITFDPSDFSYFEPTVHTYALATSPTANKVQVRGYVMTGTDDVTEQGFEYWFKGGQKAPHRIPNATADSVYRVTASGQVMTAVLEDLAYSSTYTCRAYAIAGGKTYYGEEVQFLTPEDPETALETLWSTNKNGNLASKYFHNGNLIIERNGIKYTATGQRVK